MLLTLSNTFRPRFHSRTVPAVALALLLALPSLAQENNRRLILKDGSYQLVTKYEVKGDRVRYYSAEREDWEELPNTLVDWPATEKYENDRAARAAAPEAVQIDKEAEAEEAKLPEVALGLRLPEDSGVFLLDNYKGEPQLDEINQTAGDVNKQTKANIFRGINPIGGAKQTIELDGAHAAVKSHVDVPTLYIKGVDDAPAPFESGAPGDSARSQQPQQPQQPIVAYDRFRILQVEVKGNKRIVGAVKREVTGKITQDQKVIKTTITNVNGGWLKLTPTDALAPGEYALVEMMGKEGMNLYLWDFSVDPKAPPNSNPWKPDVKLPEPLPTPKSEK